MTPLVLIVEDHLAVRARMQALLERAGTRVMATACPFEALALVRVGFEREATPAEPNPIVDLLLLDYDLQPSISRLADLQLAGLPDVTPHGLTGVDVLAHLQAMAAAHAIPAAPPAIGISSDPRFNARLERAGAVDSMCKRAYRNELVPTVMRTLVELGYDITPATPATRATPTVPPPAHTQD